LIEDIDLKLFNNINTIFRLHFIFHDKRKEKNEKNLQCIGRGNKRIRIKYKRRDKDRERKRKQKITH
jgi:hypothetical protein